MHEEVTDPIRVLTGIPKTHVRSIKWCGSPKKLQKKLLSDVKHSKQIQIKDFNDFENNLINGWFVDCRCGVKGVNKDDGERMIQCDICKLYMHNKCNDLPTVLEEFRMYFISKRVWVCPRCAVGDYNYHATHWKVIETIDVSGSPPKDQKSKSVSFSSVVRVRKTRSKAHAEMEAGMSKSFPLNLSQELQDKARESSPKSSPIPILRQKHSPEISPAPSPDVSPRSTPAPSPLVRSRPRRCTESDLSSLSMDSFPLDQTFSPSFPFAEKSILKNTTRPKTLSENLFPTPTEYAVSLALSGEMKPTNISYVFLFSFFSSSIF